MTVSPLMGALIEIELDLSNSGAISLEFSNTSEVETESAGFSQFAGVSVAPLVDMLTDSECSEKGATSMCGAISLRKRAAEDSSPPTRAPAAAVFSQFDVPEEDAEYLKAELVSSAFGSLLNGTPVFAAASEVFSSSDVSDFTFNESLASEFSAISKLQLFASGILRVSWPESPFSKFPACKDPLIASPPIEVSTSVIEHSVVDRILPEVRAARDMRIGYKDPSEGAGSVAGDSLKGKGLFSGAVEAKLPCGRLSLGKVG